MTSLSLLASATAGPAADALVVGVAQGPKGLVLAPGTAEALTGTLTAKGLVAALAALGATGKAEEVTRVATLGGGPVPVVVAVGLGPTTRTYDAEVLRRAAGAATRALAGTRRAVTTLALANGAPGAGPVHEVRSVGEGAALGGYSFTAHRGVTASAQQAPLGALAIVAPDPRGKATKAALAWAVAIGKGVSLARDLVNTAPSHLVPADLAAIAVERATAAGLTTEVIQGRALVKGGYGGIVGVGQGSANPPRLVHLSYSPAGATRTVALVGKGITFDSGGLSLKPAASMEEMKMDMGGAAAVLATTLAAAELGLRVAVEAWIPMAENMPSGTAIRPSDVLTLRGGRRVEVNNTDAEGRLILADAIVRACEDSPEIVIDVATLTGAALVALGSRTTGVMANDDTLRAHVVDASVRAGEHSWPMPLPEELRKGLDSEIADLVNTGPREGGMLTAGLFLKEFVAEGVAWAHLDIAGPAYNSGSAYGYTPHGGTGAAVRTFVQLLADLADAPA